MGRKDWEEARRVLLRLWNDSRTYDVAASLSDVEYALGNHLAAAGYIDFALDNVAPNERPETVQRFRAALEKIRKHLGTIHVEVDESGAEVRVDGVGIGRSPLGGALYVEPGHHVIEARLGAQTAQQNIQAVAGQSARITLALRPSPSLPGADRVTSLTPPEPSFGNDGGSRTSQTPGKSTLPVYVGLGVTSLGLAAWVGFGIAASSARTDAGDRSAALGESGCAGALSTSSACRDLQDTIDRQQAYVTVSTVGMGAALVGAAATLGYIFLWPARPRRATSGLFVPSLSVHASGASAAIGSSF